MNTPRGKIGPTRPDPLSCVAGDNFCWNYGTLNTDFQIKILSL